MMHDPEPHRQAKGTEFRPLLVTYLAFLASLPTTQPFSVYSSKSLAGAASSKMPIARPISR